MMLDFIRFFLTLVLMTYDIYLIFCIAESNLTTENAATSDVS